MWEEDYYQLAEDNTKKEYESGGKIRPILDYIQRVKKPGMKILEVGCGLAGVAGVLDDSVSYTGQDISEFAINRAKQRIRGKKNANLVLASADAMPFGAGEFDVIFAKFSLEHFAKPRESLMEILRVAKSGGSIILAAPNLEFPFSFPAALRHVSLRERISFYIARLWDYALRIFGIYTFRTIRQNFLDATGRYEMADDDLRYVASSFEVIGFLKKNGCRIVHADKFGAQDGSAKNAIRRFITYFPGMKFYGAELFVIAQKP